jgi:hypothetical protein
MAHEAGFSDIIKKGVWITDGCWDEELERFAELVAAAEREACAHMILSRNRGDSPRLYRDTLKLCAMLIKRRQNKLTKENENESIF